VNTLTSLTEATTRRRPSGWLGVLATVLLLLALSAPPALAWLTFPALSGRVVDDAGILPADLKSSLTASLDQLERQSGDQLVVVTLTSLQGADIADYGYQLGRSWGIGQAKLNNGVLLIVAPVERKVRIEVGYGLEGTLTDALSSVIIQQVILTRFKAGDMPGGIREGAAAIVDILLKHPEKLEQRTLATSQTNTISPQTMLLVFGGAILFFIFIFVNDWRTWKSSNKSRSGRRGSYRSTWSTGSSSSGSSSSSSGGFSGGGGSFGGGGSSGSW
jgi:uncharacterized protein